MADLRSKLFTALTGLAGAEVSGTGEDIRAQLLAVFGESKRTKSGVDIDAAAKGLKVTKRSVQRWLHNQDLGRPLGLSKDHRAKIQTRSRQASSTKRGRRRAVDAARRGSRSRYGAKITISGWQGPLGRGEDEYERVRTTRARLTPDQYEDLMNAYIDGGDQGGMGYLSSMWPTLYLENPDEEWFFYPDRDPSRFTLDITD